MSIAVAIAGLGHAFGTRVVLMDVDIAVPANSTLALFGPNGSGKSTLLRCLVGLLRPTVGAVTIDGEQPHALRPAKRARVSYLGHRPHVWDGLSCRENLRFVAQLYSRPIDVESLLDRVELRRQGSTAAGVLSQGQRQRLGIARALATEPGLLVLDEPHAALDREGADLLDGILQDVRGRVTVILATHDHERGAAVADAVHTLPVQGRA